MGKITNIHKSIQTTFKKICKINILNGTSKKVANNEKLLSRKFHTFIALSAKKVFTRGTATAWFKQLIWMPSCL